MSEQSPAPGDDDTGRGGDVAGSAVDEGPEESAEPNSGDETGPAMSDGGTGAATVVGLESAAADAVLGAVASDTGRTVLDELHEDPSTASGLADRVDCSLQTVQYHLRKLADAGLVEVVDTAVSEKGREMDVYGPASGPVVVFAGGEDDEDDVRSMLSRLVSATALLGLVSLLVQELFGDDAAAGGDVAMSRQSGEMAADAAEAAGTAAGIEPGVLFFAGGLVVLGAYVLAWYLRRRGTFDGLAPGA